MELHERDFFINRISSGVLLFDYKDKVLEIRTASPEVRYRASIIYQNHYDKCVKNGVLNEQETLESLKLNKLWTDEDEESLTKTIPEDIDKLKYQLYLNESRPSIREQIEFLLKHWRTQLKELQIRRNTFFNHTCHASALYHQKEYEIRNSTFLDGKPFEWEDARSAITFYYNSVIPNDAFRELARTTPWTVLVSASKYTNGVFDKPATKLSDEQLSLLYWTSFYDSVNQAYDSPPQRVIENNDMLDGWLIMKNKEAKEKENEQYGSQITKNKKIAEADEVFIPVANNQDAMSIDALNSNHAAALKHSRLSQLKHSPTGQVEHRDFHDVKQDLNIQKAQLFKQKMNEQRNKNKGK